MTNTESKQQRAARLVNQEVQACVSYLVSALAQGYGAAAGEHGKALNTLTEQAFELASPIPDYEEAAIQEGWESYRDQFNVLCWKDTADGATWAGTAEDLCREHDIEPYDREVYEHWIVSPWLADKLEARGEKVDRDFAGLTVWARTTTGQAISIDDVIESIVGDTYANT